MKTLIEFLIATGVAEQGEACVTFDNENWYLQANWKCEWVTFTTLLVDGYFYTARCNENGEELEFTVFPDSLCIRNTNSGACVRFN